MAYTTQTWSDGAGGGTPIDAAHLTHIEVGVKDADTRLTTVEAGKAPLVHTHPVTDLTATGAASSSTYLRGDGTWATPAGSGAVSSVNGKTGAVVLAASDVNAQPQLTPTGVKTTAYTAVANDFVLVDTTAGNVTVTFPTAPVDKTRIGVKHVVRGGTNTVTIQLGGADVLNVAAGAASGALTLLNQAAILQYVAATAVWVTSSADVPLAQLDTRYLATAAAIPESQVTNLTTDLAAKAPLASPAFTGTPTGITKAHVGLGNVDNTSDANKPISAAEQAALNGKVSLRSAARAGNYFFPIGSGITGTAAMPQGFAYAVPWALEEALTIVRMGIEVTTIGDTGSKVRMAIYADDGTFYPGTLLLDAGQAAGDVVALPELTISQALTPGIIWLAVAGQAITTTGPTLRTSSGAQPRCPISIGTTAPTANLVSLAYQMSGVTGAFPATWSTTVASSFRAARFHLRAA